VGTNHIAGMAAAGVIRFCTQVDYVKFQHIEDKSPSKGSWSGSCDPF